MSKPITATPGIPPVPGAKKSPPGPRGLSPLGSAYAVGHDPMRFALDLWHRYGDVAHFRLLSWPAYALYHPDHVKQVLQENQRNYNKDFFLSLHTAVGSHPRQSPFAGRAEHSQQRRLRHHQ